MPSSLGYGFRRLAVLVALAAGAGRRVRRSMLGGRSPRARDQAGFARRGTVRPRHLRGRPIVSTCGPADARPERRRATAEGEARPQPTSKSVLLPLHHPVHYRWRRIAMRGEPCRGVTLGNHRGSEGAYVLLIPSRGFEPHRPHNELATSGRVGCGDICGDFFGGLSY